MADGAVRLSTFGSAVPNVVRKEALALSNKIEKGQLVVFQGPVIDTYGKQRLAPGEKSDVKWLSDMDFLVAGIQGSLRKK